MPSYKDKYITIYKIVCKEESINLCYIGKTTNFTLRENNHKSDCHNEKAPQYNFQLYRVIRSFGGWDNWTMKPLQTLTGITNKEASEKERQFFDMQENTINFYIPNRTRQESHRAWYQKNKDKIKEKAKVRYECDCGKNPKLVSKARHNKSNFHVQYLESQKYERNDLNILNIPL